jgi:diguanylate cyclase (GGDEF)-like protein
MIQERRGVAVQKMTGRPLRSGVELPAIAPEQLAALPPWAAARLAALAEANQDLARRLEIAETLARHDDISGLPNHRAGVTILERTLIRHRRDQQPFAVLFIDGDNLKRYNELGYDAGNRMIARLARTLADHLRPTDSIARWLSGDEFLVVLPGADGTGAEAAAERLRAAVEVEFTGAAIPVTVSIGVARFPDDGHTPRTLIDRAVASNALAKRAGKNRVVHLNTSEG